MEEKDIKMLTDSNGGNGMGHFIDSLPVLYFTVMCVFE
jgi:hypothetical protein